MKKIVCSAAIVAAMIFSTNAKAQLVDEQNVTITMDLQPILQLDMSGPTNIDFVFDQISEYVGGITKYGATTLKVSSSVSWDLYAVGHSSSGGTNWDHQLTYGEASDALALTTLPIELLELRQDKNNPDNAAGTGTAVDYRSAFQTSPSALGLNNIYASSTPYVVPAVSEKFIAGGTGTNEFVAGGSYLVTQAAAVGAVSNYYYSIDYRIVPGLPAIFPNAANNVPTALDLVTTGAAGNYARPGVYTMNVKYVLMENQL